MVRRGEQHQLRSLERPLEQVLSSALRTAKLHSGCIRHSVYELVAVESGDAARRSLKNSEFLRESKER